MHSEGMSDAKFVFSDILNPVFILLSGFTGRKIADLIKKKKKIPLQN